MNLKGTIWLFAAREKRNIIAPIGISSPAPSIDGPAKEPENWQTLGEESVDEALEHSFQKHNVDPKDWVK